MNTKTTDHKAISDTSKEKETCKKHGCPFFTYTENGISHSLLFCNESSCQNCQFTEEYVAFKGMYMDDGYSSAEAGEMAEYAVYRRHSIFTYAD